MFKKIVIIILVLSPLLFSIIVGYPIVTRSEYQNRFKNNSALQYSRRCYAIGDLPGYITCLKKSERLNGVNLIKIIYVELSKMNFGFELIFFSFLFLQIVLSIMIISILI